MNHPAVCHELTKTRAPGVRRLRAWQALPGLVLALGCGTNWNELLVSAANAAGRTFLDTFLTDLANDVLEEADGPDGGTDTPADGNVGDGTGNGEPVVGDAARGESLYVAGGCGACHCDDAGGGCVGAAPALAEATAALLDATLRGSNHPVGASLTEQELADLEAFLAGVGTDNP